MVPSGTHDEPMYDCNRDELDTAELEVLRWVFEHRRFCYGSEQDSRVNRFPLSL